jgi:hypothetical protein
MMYRWMRWSIVTTLAFVAVIAYSANAYSQFTAFGDRTNAVLEGNWQSCREADGNYSERVYDGKLIDGKPFELHLGPYHEFALFRGTQEAHRDHTSAENLLRPYTVEIAQAQGHSRWDVAGFRLDVTLAGGSREDCESWFLTLRRLDSSSSN